MRIRSPIALGVVLLLSFIGVADAADLNGGEARQSYVSAPMAGPAAWYLRGDVGYGVHDDPTIVQSGIYDLNNTSIEDTWTAGLGFGRYFSPGVRGDITWDYRFEADVTGSAGAGPFAGQHRFGLSSHVILANLYYDFDRGSRFTPYVGVGLGAAYHQTSTGTTVGCGCTGTIEESSNWNVAGAFMAGFSINFGSHASYGGSIKDEPVYVDRRGRWHLDAGYRFLYLGEARTGNITDGVATTVAGDKVQDIFAHEFRVGLRYDIR
jgi:opacity protein-like surface antigen